MDSMIFLWPLAAVLFLASRVGAIHRHCSLHLHCRPWSYKALWHWLLYFLLTTNPWGWYCVGVNGSEVGAHPLCLPRQCRDLFVITRDHANWAAFSLNSRMFSAGRTVGAAQWGCLGCCLVGMWLAAWQQVLGKHKAAKTGLGSRRGKRSGRELEP